MILKPTLEMLEEAQ